MRRTHSHTHTFYLINMFEYRFLNFGVIRLVVVFSSKYKYLSQIERERVSPTKS